MPRKALLVADSVGQPPLLNPYSFAFVGLIAGLFTGRAHGLLSWLVDVMILHMKKAIQTEARVRHRRRSAVSPSAFLPRASVSRLFVPIAQGQVASCTVLGQFERGYLKVKVNGTYASVRPDDRPDVHDDQREIVGFPSGKSFDVWTEPGWKAADRLCVELYDAQDNFVDAHDATVIPGT